jgi:hypothetical protein
LSCKSSIWRFIRSCVKVTASIFWSRFYETVSDLLIKPNLVKFKFVIITLIGFKIR